MLVVILVDYEEIKVVSNWWFPINCWWSKTCYVRQMYSTVVAHFVTRQWFKHCVKISLCELQHDKWFMWRNNNFCTITLSNHLIKTRQFEWNSSSYKSCKCSGIFIFAFTGCQSAFYWPYSGMCTWRFTVLLKNELLENFNFIGIQGEFSKEFLDKILEISSKIHPQRKI